MLPRRGPAAGARPAVRHFPLVSQQTTLYNKQYSYSETAGVDSWLCTECGATFEFFIKIQTNDAVSHVQEIAFHPEHGHHLPRGVPFRCGTCTCNYVPDM